MRIHSITNDDDWNKACKDVNLLGDKFNFNISDSSNFDDIIILAESEDCYWVFQVDCVFTDCCIGKFNKLSIDKNDIERKFKEYVLDCVHDRLTNYKLVYDCLYDKELCHEDEYYIKHIPTSYFKGWITL